MILDRARVMFVVQTLRGKRGEGESNTTMEGMMITHLQFCFSLISPPLPFMIVGSLLE